MTDSRVLLMIGFVGGTFWLHMMSSEQDGRMHQDYFASRLKSGRKWRRSDHLYLCQLVSVPLSVRPLANAAVN